MTGSNQGLLVMITQTATTTDDDARTTTTLETNELRDPSQDVGVIEHPAPEDAANRKTKLVLFSSCALGLRIIRK
jgi:hypothetical protein